MCTFWTKQKNKQNNGTPR